MFMPDLSDVGPPAKGPGLPERIAEAPPPPVKVSILHPEGCETADELEKEIRLNCPAALINRELGPEGSLEIEINGKLIYSKKHLGEDPSIDDIVEITKWGNKGKSFLHMYLCSVAEGGEPRMVITDKKNTPLPKRIIMSCTIS